MIRHSLNRNLAPMLPDVISEMQATFADELTPKVKDNGGYLLLWLHHDL